MSENEQHCDNNTVVENSAAPMIRESRMKCEWHQKINDAVHCNQTPFNIALILEQTSNYNIVSREKMSMEKVTWMKQNNVISDEKVLHQNYVKQKRNTCLKGWKKNTDDDRKEMNIEKCIQPNKCKPIICFFNESKN